MALDNEMLLGAYPEWLLQFAYICCVTFIVIGIPGNLISIIALASCKKFQNATAAFIINLQVSNLLSCCTVLPEAALTFATRHWTLGPALCSLHALLKYSLNTTAHFTVIAITLSRYIMVCHPHLYPRLYKKVNLRIYLIIIWVSAFGLFIPALFGKWGRFDLLPREGICTMVPDKNDICPKKIFISAAFLGTSLTIILFYGLIWWKVRKTTKKRQAHYTRSLQPSFSYLKPGASTMESAVDNITTDNVDKNLDNPGVTTPLSVKSSVVQFFRSSYRQTIKRKGNSNVPTRKDKTLAAMIIVTAVCFILCHLPIMIMVMLFGYKAEVNDFVHIVAVLAYLLDYVSYFLNPIVYVIMSTEYRQAYKCLFHRLKKKITSYLKA